MTSEQASIVPTYSDLAGKTAFVTGGSKGVGRSTCRMLAQNGVKVAVVARDQSSIDVAVEELRELGGEAIGVVADCTSYGAIEAARVQTEKELGEVEILIPFAGGFGGRTPVQDISEDEWHYVVDSNLTSTFLTVKCFLPGMIDRRKGSIITMSSASARFLDVTVTASYAAAKAGISMFTRHIAKELGPHGIRANTIAPATMTTERITSHLSDEVLTFLAGLSPLGQMGRPEDAAYATLYLASDAAAWVTGITLDVAGGRVML